MPRYTALLNDLLSRVADRGATLAGREVPEESFANQCRNLVFSTGEATGIARARAILDRYSDMPEDARLDALRDIANLNARDTGEIDAALAGLDTKDPSSLRRLHFASEPASQKLIRSLNRAPGATRRLVDMRTDLLPQKRADAALRSLDDDFNHLFSSWFNRGFLSLRRIDWTTSAETLERVIGYEAVHEIKGWSDLRNRVNAPDRRLYGFFHPALQDDPLIFVEVALTREIPASIGSIIGPRAKTVSATDATTAVFYSISNCQKGLAGISFGNFLIKQVVEELQREMHDMKTFVTLSPVPGLRKWALDPGSDAKDVLTEDQLEAIARIERSPAAAAESSGLSDIAARYLLKSRRPNGSVTDPVARFHLGNGARLERIHPGADTSENGMRNSWGVMVNYLYALPDIERNHEAFSVDSEVVASKAVRQSARRQERPDV